MTSVRAELSSARLVDERTSSSSAQDLTLSEVTSDSIYTEISARIRGRFTADLAAILKSTSAPQTEQQLRVKPDRPERNTYISRQFALDCLRASKVQFARNFIQRHAPEQLGWLECQISCSKPQAQTHIDPSRQSAFLANIATVPASVRIDAEAGRIAYHLGQFGLFRAWAYGHAAHKGDGWIERKELETLWRHIGVAYSPRHARRLIKDGVTKGYWTQDSLRNRIYLTGQVKVAAQLVRKAFETGKQERVGTNLPGKRRVIVSLAGSMQQASARLYAAWFISKDTRCNGIIISRETLCNLWGVSVPTLLAWERIAGIDSQANYAQTNDTAIDRIPEYAYLTLNRDGSYAAAWRLPNIYTVGDPTIQQHSHTGKAKQVRRAVHVEIARSEQRGSIGDTASLRSDKRYFTENAHSKSTPFRACEIYLRKLGRRNGDLSQRRFFYVGERYGVCIFEAYNLSVGACETNIHQRLIWQESHDDFVAMKKSYRHFVGHC